jgi:hypothetical protein
MKSSVKFYDPDFSGLKHTIELPWNGGIELGVRNVLGSDGIKVRAFYPEGILEMLDGPNLRFQRVDGFMSAALNEDVIFIEKIVPYLISSKNFGIAPHVQFRVTIGDTYTMPVMLGQVDYGTGGTEIKLGNPVPVPPRQPCEIEVIFDCNTQEMFRKQLIETEAEGGILRLGLRLVGVVRTELNKDDW